MYDHRLGRYDYLYRKEQLEPWVPRITEAELKVNKVLVYFNNHARSKSVRNAFLLMDMLSLPHKSKEIQLLDQFTLGEFESFCGVLDTLAQLQQHRENRCFQRIIQGIEGLAGMFFGHLRQHLPEDLVLFLQSPARAWMNISLGRGGT